MQYFASRKTGTINSKRSKAKQISRCFYINNNLTRKRHMENIYMKVNNLTRKSHMENIYMKVKLERESSETS